MHREAIAVLEAAKVDGGRWARRDVVASIRAALETLKTAAVLIGQAGSVAETTSLVTIYPDGRKEIRTIGPATQGSLAEKPAQLLPVLPAPSGPVPVKSVRMIQRDEGLEAPAPVAPERSPSAGKWMTAEELDQAVKEARGEAYTKRGQLPRDLGPPES